MPDTLLVITNGIVIDAMHYTDDEIFFLGVDAVGAITGAAAAIMILLIAIAAIIIILVKFRWEQRSVKSGHKSGQDVVSIISNNKINFDRI